MSSTLETIRRRFLRETETGDFYVNAEITALTGSSFTSPQRFQDTAIAEDYLQTRQAGIHRFGAASSVDFYRPAGLITIATGLVTQRGLTYSDTTLGTESIEMAWWKVRLDKEWLDMLNVEMAHETFTTLLAVSDLGSADGDMFVPTDTNFTDVGTPTTSAKSSSAAPTVYGPRSYNLVGDAVNEGTQTASMTIRKSGQFSAFTINTATTGTGSFRGYDVTNSTDIGTAVTNSEAAPQLMCIQNQVVPATCESVALRMLGQEAVTSMFWNQVWFYNQEKMQNRLPASIFEAFHAPKFIRMVPKRGTGVGLYDPYSMDPQPLTEGYDYRLIINHGDAQPYKVLWLRDNPYQWPIMVEAKLPLSALITMSAEADSTIGQIEKLMPRLKKAALEKIYNVGSRRHPDWEFQYNLAVSQLSDAARARTVPTIANPRPYLRGVSRL